MGGIFYVFFNYLYRNMVFIVLGIICCMYLLFIANIFFQKESLSNQTFHQLLSIFVFASLWSYLPKNKTLELLAKSSYSLYILHYPVFLFILGICNYFVFNLYYALPISIVFVVLTTYFYAIFFEKRIIFKKI